LDPKFSLSKRLLTKLKRSF